MVITGGAPEAGQIGHYGITPCVEQLRITPAVNTSFRLINAGYAAGGEVDLQLLRDIILDIVETVPLKILCKHRLDEQIGIIDVACPDLVIVPVQICTNGDVLRKEIDVEIFDEPEDRRAEQPRFLERGEVFRPCLKIIGNTSPVGSLHVNLSPRISVVHFIECIAYGNIGRVPCMRLLTSPCGTCIAYGECAAPRILF